MEETTGITKETVMPYYLTTLLCILLSDESITNKKSLLNNIINTFGKLGIPHGKKGTKLFYNKIGKQILTIPDKQTKHEEILTLLREYLQIPTQYRLISLSLLTDKKQGQRWTAHLRTFCPLHHSIYRFYNCPVIDDLLNRRTHESFMVRESSTGDGNCFFHSLCYLTNSEYQEEVERIVKNPSIKNIASPKLVELTITFRKNLADYIKNNPLLWEEITHSISSGKTGKPYTHKEYCTHLYNEKKK